MRCGSCKYWESDNGIGVCRYYPPRSVAVQPTEEQRLDALWPRTKEDDWCGHWAVKVEMEPEGGVHGKAAV